MRRPTLLLCSLLACLSFVAVLAVPPNTPPDGTQNTTPMCVLDGLQFTNGLQLVGTFVPNIFHYQCTCATFAAGFTTVVRPHMMDDGSSAEITFNGQPINFRTNNQGISNGGPDGVAPMSPLTESSPLTFQPGNNTIMIGVGCNGRGLPVPCYYQYHIHCELPAESFVVGDPAFVGLRGQQYQVHGVAGEIYNIVSDAELQYNSRFVFLEQGKCPVVNGKKQKGCFSHAGSYLGELGLKTKAGDRIHFVSGDAQTGFAAVEINGKPLAMGDTVLLAADMGSVSYNSTHAASVSIGNWLFDFENSDMFINQRVRVTEPRRLRSHGLLGQTWRENTYPNSIKYEAGTVDDYVIREQDIFGDNFVFNSFN
jgi:hypothetical protein